MWCLIISKCLFHSQMIINPLLSIDSKEAEAAASAYNTPYNQGGPSGSGNNDLPPSYNVSIKI